MHILVIKNGVEAMFLTKECDYGVRVIRALADGTKKTVEAIAIEEDIPKKYAYKIVKKLENGGYVASMRGRGGGYRLCKPLDTFTLVDIVLAVDSKRYVNECMREESNCQFKNHPERPCAVHKELNRLQDLIVAELSIKTMDQVFMLEGNL